MKPITPEEICSSRKNNIPDFVIQAFNNALKNRVVSTDTNVIYLSENEMVKEIMTSSSLAGKQADSHQIYENRWLDIEHLYIKAGWRVTHKLGTGFVFDAT